MRNSPAIRAIATSLTASAIFLCAHPAIADTVRLTSGKVYHGKIYMENDTEISLVIDSAAGITSIPIARTDIGTIEKEDGGQELLLTFSKFVRAYSEGDRYFNGGSYYQAIEFYKQAAELNPKVYASYYNLGMTYAKLGLRNEARHYLKKSAETARAVNSAGRAERDFIAMAEAQIQKLDE